MDKCTMFAEKVLINRRNINTDVGKEVDGCKKFLLLEVPCRIVAAFMQVLCPESLDDEPTSSVLPDSIVNVSGKEKKKFLDELCGKKLLTILLFVMVGMRN